MLPKVKFHAEYDPFLKKFRKITNSKILLKLYTCETNIIFYSSFPAQIL